MKGYIVTRWLEPYVLLETAKKFCQMKDYTFDGFNKTIIKQSFLKALEQSGTFGLYMKNVNKFYLFTPDSTLSVQELLTSHLNLKDNDFYKSENADEPFDVIDLGKAEASFITA